MSGDRGATGVPLSSNLNQWEETLINHGVVNRFQALRAKGFTEDMLRDLVLSEEEEVKEKERVEEALFGEKPHAAETADDLDELEDDEAFADDSAIRKYRELRVRELEAERAKQKFGHIRQIDRDSWMTEVNETSKEFWVVVHLYQDYVPDCTTMERLLNEIASSHKKVKFLRITSTEAVRNWPDDKLPVLFLYRHGEMQQQLFGRPGLKLKEDIAVSDVADLLKDCGVFEDDDLKKKVIPSPSLRIRRGDGLYNDSETDATWDKTEGDDD